MTATHLDALLARLHDGLADATDRAALADVLIDAGREELAAFARAWAWETAAAQAFIRDVTGDWPLDAFEATAERGLSSADALLLRELCDEVETASDYAASEAGVLLYVMGHVASVRMREAADE
jgi:hypothetical protein